MAVAGYIISAWSSDGRLAVGRCKEPSRFGDDSGMVQGWVVTDTARAMGKAVFGDLFVKTGPSSVYGGSCAYPPAGEKYPGAWAESTLARCHADGMPIEDVRRMVQDAIKGPETPLEYASAVQTKQLADGVLRAAADAFKPRPRF